MHIKYNLTPERAALREILQFFYFRPLFLKKTRHFTRAFTLLVREDVHAYGMRVRRPPLSKLDYTTDDLQRSNLEACLVTPIHTYIHDQLKNDLTGNFFNFKKLHS